VHHHPGWPIKRTERTQCRELGGKSVEVGVLSGGSGSIITLNASLAYVQAYHRIRFKAQPRGHAFVRCQGTSFKGDWSRLVPNSPPNLPQHQTSCIRLNCSPGVPRPSLDCQGNQTRPRKRKTAPQRTKSAPLSLEGDVAARPQPHLLLRFQLS